jgi:hypothetical protein
MATGHVVLVASFRHHLFHLVARLTPVGTASARHAEGYADIDGRLEQPCADSHSGYHRSNMIRSYLGAAFQRLSSDQSSENLHRDLVMSLGTILVIILIIFLLGGFSGRFGGSGYGYGHRGNGLIGIILIIVVVLLLTGRL